MTSLPRQDWAQPGSLIDLLSRAPAWARTALRCIGWLSIGFFIVGRFYGIWMGDLIDWDEGLYAWRAKVAVVQGAWLDQSDYSYNGFYSGAFPPLLIWEMAAMFKVFGFQEWAARLPSVLMGVAALLAVYAIGRLLVGNGVGVFAACFLGSISYFLRYTRLAQFDVPYTAWMMLFLAFYLAGMRHPHRRRRAVLIAGVCMGAGLMTKIAVAAFAAVNVFLWQAVLLLVAWRLRDARWLNPLCPEEFASPPAGDTRPRRSPARRAAMRYLQDHLAIIGVAAVIWLPWHLYMLATKGHEFFWWYFNFHLLGRSLETIDFHDGDWGFYFNAAWDRVPTVLFGIALLGLIASIFWVMILFVARKPNAGDLRDPADPTRSWLPGILLSLIWVLSLGSVLQSSATKREIYLLPIYCHLALIAAIYLDFWLRRPSRGVLHCWSVLGVFALVFFIGRKSDPRASFAWGLLTGEYPPHDGGGVLGGVLAAMAPFLLRAAAAAAILVAIPWAIAMLRAAWRPHRRQFMAFGTSLVFLVTTLYQLFHEARDQYKHEDHFDRAIYEPLKAALDDPDTWPHAVFLDTPGGGAWPAVAFYFYGAGPITNSPPNRFVNHMTQFEPGILDPFRKPGALVIVESGFGRWDEEASAAFDRELEGFEIIAKGDWDVFWLYGYTGTQGGAEAAAAATE